jgi:DNA-binding IclR family transcriptional regulator
VGPGEPEGVLTVPEAFFVARTMQALEVLSFEPSSAPQVAEALQVHPRTARRLLNRLAADGWLQRIEGSRPLYTPTMRIVALAAQLADRAPVVRLGAAVARDLQATSGNVVHLAVPSYRSALRLLRVNGDAGSRPQLRDLAPAHATAGGKLLLAYRDRWRESVLERPLDPVTASTVIEPDAVRAEAEATRARGFATEDGEFRPGVRAIAAPVRDRFGDVVAALAVSGGAAELDDTGRAARLLAAAADELTEQLVAGSP